METQLDPGDHGHNRSYFEDTKSTAYKWAEDDSTAELNDYIVRELSSDRMDKVHLVSKLMDRMTHQELYKPSLRRLSVSSDSIVDRGDCKEILRSAASTPRLPIYRHSRQSSTPRAEQTLSPIPSSKIQSVTNITIPSSSSAEAAKTRDPQASGARVVEQESQHSRSQSTNSWSSRAIREHADDLLRLTDLASRANYKPVYIEDLQEIPDNRARSIPPTDNTTDAVSKAAATGGTTSAKAPVADASQPSIQHELMILQEDYEKRGKIIDQLLDERTKRDRTGSQEDNSAQQQLEQSMQKARVAEQELQQAKKEIVQIQNFLLNRTKHVRAAAVPNHETPNGLNETTRVAHWARNVEDPIGLGLSQHQALPVQLNGDVDSYPKSVREELLEHQVQELQNMLRRSKEELQEIMARQRSDTRPLTPDMMPDATYKHLRSKEKLYYRLQLYEIDQLCGHGAANLLKNILIQLDIPFTSLRDSILDTKSRLDDQRQLRQFADDVHYNLYHGEPMDEGAPDELCLSQMVKRVGKLARAAERKRSHGTGT